MRVAGILKSMLAVAVFGIAGLSHAEVYNIDAAKSQLTWHGEKVMIATKHHGTIEVKSGKIEFKDGEPIDATIVVDMKTIVDKDLDDPKWNTKLVGHLKSDDFFAVETHPEATILAKKFTKIKDDQYKISGDLTVKGKTNPVEFHGTVVRKDGKPAGIKADLEFDRSKHEVKFGSGAFFKGLGDKLISDTIKIEADLRI